MANKKFNASEQLLRSKGFTPGPDGIWRKEGGPPENPSSGADPKPNKRKQVRKKKPKAKTGPVCRSVAIVTVKTVRSRDYDGLGASSKHYLDALRHCGMFEDDSREYLEVLAVSEPVRHFSEEETIIEVYQLPQCHED